MANARKVLTVQVSPDTPWDPIAAVRLMAGWFGLRTAFNCCIRAEPGSIIWSVEVGRNEVNAVTSSLHIAYPQAKVEVSPKTELDIGKYLYHFESASPHIGPLLYAGDFDKPPLSEVIGLLGALDKGESVTWELLLWPGNSDYRTLGDRMLNESIIKWHTFMDRGQALHAAQLAKMGMDLQERYDEEISQIARRKLQQTVREARLLLKIQADPVRRQILYDSLQSAITLYQRPAIAYLLPGDSDTFPLVLTADEAAALWHLPTQEMKTADILWQRTLMAPAPMTAAAQELEGESAKGGVLIGVNHYQGRDLNVRLSDEQRERHVNIIGSTGTGKSTLFYNMIGQDIGQGKGVAVIDPHGDLIRDLLKSPQLHERYEEVVLIDTSDTDYPVGLNMLYRPPTLLDDELEQASERVVGAIKHLFMVDTSDQWGPRMEQMMSASVSSLMSTQTPNIMDVSRLLSDEGFRKEVLELVNDTVTLQYWLHEFPRQDKRWQSERASSVTDRMLIFFRNPLLRRMLCQPKGLDLNRLIEENKIVLFNLVTLEEIAQNTLGTLLIAQIQNAFMSRFRQEERTPYYLYIDEVANFVTTNLPEMMNDVRKYKLRLVMGNQFLDQLAGKTLESLMGNVAASIVFRVGDPDAKRLASHLGGSVEPAALTTLPNYQTVVRLAGEMPPFTLHTLPAENKVDNRDLVEEIRERSRTLYATPKAQVDLQLNERIRKPEKPIQFKPDPGRFHG